MHVAAFHVVPPFVDTSMPDTATLSVAVPLMVNGFGDVMITLAPLAGVVIADEGAVPSVAVVVYENG